MSKDERIRIFREECHSYPYYLSQISRIEDKMKILQNRMEAVYSPITDKIGSTPTPHELDYIGIIEMKTELEEAKKYYEDITQWILDVIDDIPSAAYKGLVWTTYVQRVSLQSVSDKFYIGKDYLYRVRRKYMKYVLTDERMKEYEEIKLRNPEPEEDEQS